MFGRRLALVAKSSLLIAGASALIACGSDPTNPPPPPGGSDGSVGDGGIRNQDASVDPSTFSASVLAAKIAAANCSFEARCQPFLLAYFGQTEAQCVTNQAAELTKTLESIGPAVTAGRIRYQSQFVDTWMTEIRDADCVLGRRADEGTARVKVLAGTRAAGQACAFSEECVQRATEPSENLYCTAAPGLCGTCTAKADVNQPCPEGVCVPGAGCFQVDQQGTTRCLTVVLSENDPCGTAQTGLCRGSLQCVGATTFTCQRPAGRGAACDPMLTDAADCDIYAGDTCAGDMCQAAMLTQAGMSCAAETAICPQNYYCPQTTCDPLPQAGMNCIGTDANICGPDAFCNGATCAPTKAGGQACASGAECSGDNTCIFTSPTAGTCGALAWHECN